MIKPITASLLLVSATAHAQLDFDVSGGASFTTAPSVDRPADAWQGQRDIKSGTPKSMVALKVAWNRKHWQYGVEADAMVLHYHYLYLGFPNPYPGTPDDATIANPAIPVKAFVNRRIRLHGCELYAGLNAGTVFAEKSHDEFMYYGQATVNGSGWTAGLQAGIVYKLSKHVGLTAGTGANYMDITANHFTYTLWQIPVTGGVRYKM